VTTIPAGTTILSDLEGAWRVSGHGARLRAVRAAAERLRTRLAGGPRVLSVRTLPRMTFVYPTRYAFRGVLLAAPPFVAITHRTVLVQFLQYGILRNLLFDPTDVEGLQETPVLARVRQALPRRLWKYVVTPLEPLETQLRALRISPEDIDYLAFDHVHMQDLRSLLGAEGRVARFPNAMLLMQETAWREWDDPHPLERAWLIPDGKRGVPDPHVVLMTDDIWLGDGVALVRTPGRTAGHQTLFLHTADGVWGVSASACAADGWSPLESRIPGLARTCRMLDLDVVRGASTPGLGAEHYTSMVLERTVVDRMKKAPAFVQMLPSSELDAGPLSLGLSPAVVQGELSVGEVVDPVRAAEIKRTVAKAVARA
jgi:hypothetical protein